MCKHTFNASSHTSKSYLSRTYNTLYIQEQSRTFVHTINSLVVHQNHRNIQMLSQNLMLKQIIANVGVNFSIHIPDVIDIAYLTNISTISPSYITHPPTYDHLRRHFLNEKEGSKKLVPY